MPDVLIFADTVTSPEMRHEVPVLVPDPFLYAEKDGKKITMSTAFEVERIAEAGIETHAYEEFGYDELLAEGKRTRFDIIALDLPLNACRAWGIEEAVVPWKSPAYVVDHLRENGRWAPPVMCSREPRSRTGR